MRRKIHFLVKTKKVKFGALLTGWVFMGILASQMTCNFSINQKMLTWSKLIRNHKASDEKYLISKQKKTGYCSN